MGGGGGGTLNQLSPEFTQLIQTAMPYISQAGATYGPSTAAAGAVGTQLDNFNALSPADIAQLSSASGAAVESAGKTAAATSGGVPNAALQTKNLAQEAGQTTGRTSTQLGEIASTQNLQAKVAAGNLFSGLSAESLQAITGALNTGASGQLSVAQQQQQAANSKNQAIGSAFGGIGSLAASSQGSGSKGSGDINAQEAYLMSGG